MPLTIIRADITTLEVDAVVNAANNLLKQGGGVCGAIFRAAGEAELQAACDRLAPVETGDAVLTPGFRLPARHIIHAVGPVYRDGRSGERAALASAYRRAFELAVEHGLASIAFPLISSGIYGYPKAEALAVATSTLRACLDSHELAVTLVVFDKAAFELSRDLLGAVEAYIDQHYVERFTESRQRRLLWEAQLGYVEQTRAMHSAAPSYVLAETFCERLFELIGASGLSDVEVYKRANLDRKLFSKLRGNKDYSPSKRTAVALAIALELSPADTADLLARAGYALSQSRLDDVIVQFFIENGRYDLFAINEVLFSYDQPLLGA